MSELDFAFDDSIVLRKGQPGYRCCFVPFNTQYKALEFADLAGSDLLEPGVELFSCASAQHLGKLLNEVVSQLYFWMALAKLTNGLLLLWIQLFWSGEE